MERFFEVITVSEKDEKLLDQRFLLLKLESVVINNLIWRSVWGEDSEGNIHVFDISHIKFIDDKYYTVLKEIS